jgi:hypothetical protein
MTQLGDIVLDLQDSDATLADLGVLANLEPLDPIIDLNREAIKRRRHDLERELHDLLKRQQLDLIRYKIARSGGGPCPASGVARSIWSFQELLTSVFEAVRSRGNQSPRQSEDSGELSALVFASAERGSVVVSLSIPNERLLLVQSDLDVSLQLVFDVLQIPTSGGLRGIAKRVGFRSTAALYLWAENSVEHGLEISIHWQKTVERGRAASLSLNEALLLKTTIEAAHDDVAETIELDCQLLNLDSLTGTFLLETADGRQITGGLADEFPRSPRPTLNRRYRATLMRVVRQSYATGEQSAAWILHKLLSRR